MPVRRSSGPSLAAAFLVPYLLWALYATTLNAGLAALNS